MLGRRDVPKHLEVNKYLVRNRLWEGGGEVLG